MFTTHTDTKNTKRQESDERRSEAKPEDKQAKKHQNFRTFTRRLFYVLVYAAAAAATDLLSFARCVFFGFCYHYHPPPTLERPICARATKYYRKNFNQKFIIIDFGECDTKNGVSVWPKPDEISKIKTLSHTQYNRLFSIFNFSIETLSPATRPPTISTSSIEYWNKKKVHHRQRQQHRKYYQNRLFTENMLAKNAKKNHRVWDFFICFSCSEHGGRI